MPAYFQTWPIITVLLVALSLSACAGTLGPVRKPCRIEGITLNVMDELAAENYCKMGLGTLRDEADQAVPLTDKTRTWGCFKGKEVVMVDDAQVLVHEFKHLLETYCAQEAR